MHSMLLEFYLLKLIFTQKYIRKKKVKNMIDVFHDFSFMIYSRLYFHFHHSILYAVRVTVLKLKDLLKN